MLSTNVLEVTDPTAPTPTGGEPENQEKPKKKKAEAKPSRNYAYGAWAPRDPGELSAFLEMAATRVWYMNALRSLAIERRMLYHNALDELDPALPALRRDQKQKEREFRDAERAVKDSRCGSSSRKVASPLHDAVKTARKERAAARKAVKSREDLAKELPGFGGRMAVIDGWFSGARADLEKHVTLREHVPEGGTVASLLSSGTRDVCKVHAKAFLSGSPPVPARFDGSGTLTVRTGKSKSYTFADLEAGALSGMIRLERIDHCRPEPHTLPDPASKRSQRRRHYRISLLLIQHGPRRADKSWVTFEAMLHREIPPDALIKEVHLHRVRVGYGYDWKVRFVCSRATEEHWLKFDPPAGGEVRIDLRWTREEDGSILAATWEGDDGRSGRIDLPAQVTRRQAKADFLRESRDGNFDRVKKDLAERIVALPSVPEWLTHWVGDLRDAKACRAFLEWRDTGRLVRLTRHWSANRFDGDEKIFRVLEHLDDRGALRSGRRRGAEGPPIPRLWAGWCGQNRHLFDWQVNETRKMRASRAIIYRTAILDLARSYRKAIVSKLNLKEIARRKGADDDEPRNKAAQVSRSIAAPSILMGYVEETFTEVEKVARKLATAASGG